MQKEWSIIQVFAVYMKVKESRLFLLEQSDLIIERLFISKQNNTQN